MSELISFREFKKKRELTVKHKSKKCRHGEFLIDPNNREVTCQKCNSLVDPMEEKDIAFAVGNLVADYLRNVGYEVLVL